MVSKRFAAAALAVLAICALALVRSANAGDGSVTVGSPQASINLTTFQAATVVVGQPDFSQGMTNQGLSNPAADTISDPYGNAGVASNGALYLSDFSNHRVLGFLTVPTANDANADFVLGQPDFVSSDQGVAANQLGGPQTTIGYKKMLIVDDFYNSRVLIWKKAPTANQVAANVVVGQSGFGSRGTNCTAAGMSAPETSAVAGGKLVVADSSNNRVLIWKKIPASNGKAAKIVLGQGNFTTCVENNDGTGNGGAPSARNLGYPSGVWTDGKRLVVLDSDNNRVLIWEKFPTKNFQPADIALGQPDFLSNAHDNDGTGASGTPSAKNLNYPYDGVYSNGAQLFVADEENSRILIWNTFPKQNFAPADVVLGQPSFSCGVQSNDGTGCVSGTPSAKNLSHPRGIFQVNGRLIVTDGSDNRYLIY